MALHEPTNKIYLTVSLGRIRKKTTKEDASAKERQTEKGDTIYERVYNAVSGTLENITFFDHKEYGKSWTVLIKDGEDLYAVQVHENSRYGIDLLKKIPNLSKGRTVKITPYDFELNNKRKIGLSIEQSGIKVEPYYQKFTQLEDGKYKVENLHGFPNFDGDPKDKDDLKIYYTQVAKFLRGKAQEHIEGNFGRVLPESIADEIYKNESTDSPEDEDLPF